MNTTQDRPIHQGHNIKRFREMRGIKQEALAAKLGDDWNQKRVSQLESKEVIDEVILEQVAQSLDIPLEAIKNYTDEVATTFFNTFNDSSVSNVIGNYGSVSINPVEEWKKAVEDSRKLAEDNKALYERLLQSEREKVEMLERLLKGK